MRNILEIKRGNSEREEIYRDLSFPSVLKTQMASMFGVMLPWDSTSSPQSSCSRVGMELTWGGLHRAPSPGWRFSGSILSLPGNNLPAEAVHQSPVILLHHSQQNHKEENSYIHNSQFTAKLQNAIKRD